MDILSTIDLVHIIKWWVTIGIVSILFFPLTSNLFSHFVDKGYSFSKVISTVIVSYAILLLGTFHIVAFSKLSIIGILISIFFIHVVLLRTNKIKPIFFQLKKAIIFLFIFEELLFLLSIIAWSYVRIHNPEIHGLEKYMDFGFINSLLRTEYFPAKDMWFTPFSINYYYFGHLMTAVLTKLSGIPSNITFNLMIASIFAYCVVLPFSIGINLFYILFSKKEKEHETLSKRSIMRSGIGGLLIAFLVSLSGNLHTIYTLFKPYQNEKPVPFWELVFSPSTFPNSYWYPNATRFIYNTIHEFPIYSFVVSDLHGHVLSIPLVLTLIALTLHIIIKRSLSIPVLIFLSFLLSVAYMTNAWDGIIYFLLSALVISYISLQKVSFSQYQQSIMHKVSSIMGIKYSILNTLYLILLLGVGVIVFSLPFSIFFKPFVSGFGVLCAPEFLVQLKQIGPLLFEGDHCQKSPLYQLFILYGFFYFWVLSFFVFLYKKRQTNSSDIFVTLLILLSTILIIIPEFVYAKDIYPAHYRANTMFKLVYQSFIMLSISSGYIIVRIATSFQFHIFHISSYLKLVTLFMGTLLFTLVSLYPHFAINSYYGDLKNKHSLDGTLYLRNLYPTDYEAIIWLNANVKGQPVILEAQGDSYTDYARVSSNTGLPTLLGWTVHEWLWRGTYDIPAPRISEIQNLYETNDITLTKSLIKKYDVKLIFIGDLERQKYPNINQEKFEKLGKIIYQNGDTKVVEL